MTGNSRAFAYCINYSFNFTPRKDFLALQHVFVQFFGMADVDVGEFVVVINIPSQRHDEGVYGYFFSQLVFQEAVCEVACSKGLKSEVRA